MIHPNLDTLDKFIECQENTLMRILRLSIVTMLIVISILFVRTIQIKAESPDSGNSAEQNAIKITLESYFESRYRSLSALQLESFESLVDKSPEGTAFLRSETDKLEVEIQHAKLNRLGYVRYEFFLNPTFVQPEAIR